TAGQSQARLRHRQAQLVPGALATVFGPHQQMQQIPQHRRGQARGVGVDE
ncbi:Virus attachment protein p12 family, partial [Dysosmobacter welbionis]